MGSEKLEIYIVISTKDSKTTFFVFPANENIMIFEGCRIFYGPIKILFFESKVLWLSNAVFGMFVRPLEMKLCKFECSSQK